MVEELKPVAPDHELVIDETTRPDTYTNFLFQVILATIFTCGIMGGVWALGGQGGTAKFIYNVMLNRGPIQWFSLGFGMAVLAHVILKSGIVKRQRRTMDLDFEEYENDFGLDENVTELREVMRASDHFDDSILLRRIDRSMAQWLGSRDVSLVATWSGSESDREYDASAASHLMTGVMLAMIPLLGFIGTVIGLSGAVAGFSDFLGGSTEMSEITGALKEVTSQLGTAFDTTLLALVLSVVLTFPMTLAIRRENETLAEFDSFVDDVIISKLPPSEPASIKIENLEDSIDAAFRRYIPDPDRYDEVFSRAIDKAGSVVQDKFAQLITSYEAALSEMTSRLSANLSSAGDSMAASMQGVVQDIARQDEALVASRRSIATEESDRFAGMMESFQVKATETASVYTQGADALVAATTDGMDKSVGAAAELGLRLEEVRETAAQIDQMLQLQKTIEASLEGLSASSEFQKTLTDLRSHLETTDEFCKKMAKPRVITFREEPES